MALRTHFKVDVLTNSGASLNNITATTSCRNIFVLWMNLCLHWVYLTNRRLRVTLQNFLFGLPFQLGLQK